MTLRFDNLGLVTRNMAVTLAFYRHLGLEIPAEADTEDHVQVPLPGGTRLLFDTVGVIASFDPSFDPDGDLGGRTLGFACDDDAEVDSAHAAIVAAGYRSHLQPFDAFWGQRYATVVDPDGNHVDLFGPVA